MNESSYATVPPAWADAIRGLTSPGRQRPWRAFWLILAIGFLLRLLSAFYGHWYWRVDEVFQYLEQAHRIVFGYGAIPWEYRYDVRAWLTAGIAMPPLYLAKWLGIEMPKQYATMVNSWNALLSMTIPVCSYLTARRLLNEKAARWALVLTCFWYEFIILAPRTLSEIYATYFFMAALAAGAGKNRGRWAAAGCLLGLAMSIRPHYAPLVAIVGILWLWQLPRTLSLTAIAGGIGALLFWGMVDWLTLGGWWVSIINYLEYVPILFDEARQDKPWWRHLKYLAIASSMLYPAVVLASLPHLRRLWPLLLMLAALLPYLAHYNQEYSNLFVFLPLFWLLAAGVLAVASDRSKKIWMITGTPGNRRLTATPGRLKRLSAVSIFCAVCISCAGLAGGLPQMKSIFFVNDFFSTTPRLQVTYRLHDLMEGEDDAVLVFAGSTANLLFGGFYALHRNIPVLHLESDLLHQKIWRQSGYLKMENFATHVVAPPGLGPLFFDSILMTEDAALYINKKKPFYPVAEQWVYDYVNPGLQVQEKLPPRQFTPYNPDL